MKSQDYLQGLRNKRADDEKKGIKRKMIDDREWDKFLKDDTLNEYQRLEQIKMKARMMEQRAEMNEKLMRHNGLDSQDVEKTIAVNDLYLEAIQAKLRLLD